MSVSGAWSGVYHIMNGQMSGSFLITLQEGGSTLSGMTEEPDTFGMFGGGVAYATLTGQRTENSVVFEKLFEDAPQGLPAITYVGVVNAEETQIEGDWIIPGVMSGPFKMSRRGSGVGEAIKRTVTVDR